MQRREGGMLFPLLAQGRLDHYSYRVFRFLVFLKCSCFVVIVSSLCLLYSSLLHMSLPLLLYSLQNYCFLYHSNIPLPSCIIIYQFPNQCFHFFQSALSFLSTSSRDGAPVALWPSRSSSVAC